MRRIFLALCGLSLVTVAAFAQQPLDMREQQQREQIVLKQAMGQAVSAPSRTELLDQATLRMSESLMYLPKAQGERLMRVFDIPDRPSLLGFVFNAATPDWVGTVSYVPAGFTAAESLLEWSADEILSSMRSAMTADNAARSANGEAPLEVRQWLEPPAYDAEQHRLVWSVLVTAKDAPGTAGGAAVYNVVAFGRSGYVHIQIPTSADQIAQHKANALLILGGLYFVPGNDYRDHVTGEPVAGKMLETLFGVRAIEKAEALTTFWESDIAIPAIAGGVLILGAGLIGIARFRMIPRRRV